MKSFWKLPIKRIKRNLWMTLNSIAMKSGRNSLIWCHQTYTDYSIHIYKPTITFQRKTANNGETSFRFKRTIAWSKRFVFHTPRLPTAKLSKKVKILHRNPRSIELNQSVDCWIKLIIDKWACKSPVTDLKTCVQLYSHGQLIVFKSDPHCRFGLWLCFLNEFLVLN